MKPDFHYTQATARGYRILAGEFNSHDVEASALLRSIASHIEHTGGRAAIVVQASGNYAIYRPLAEMETITQTEQRIKRRALRNG